MKANVTLGSSTPGTKVPQQTPPSLQTRRPCEHPIPADSPQSYSHLHPYNHPRPCMPPSSLQATCTSASHLHPRKLPPALQAPAALHCWARRTGSHRIYQLDAMLRSDSGPVKQRQWPWVLPSLHWFAVQQARRRCSYLSRSFCWWYFFRGHTLPPLSSCLASAMPKCPCNAWHGHQPPRSAGGSPPWPQP